MVFWQGWKKYDNYARIVLSGTDITSEVEKTLSRLENGVVKVDYRVSRGRTTPSMEIVIRSREEEPRYKTEIVYNTLLDLCRKEHQKDIKRMGLQAKKTNI